MPLTKQLAFGLMFNNAIYLENIPDGKAYIFKNGFLEMWGEIKNNKKMDFGIIIDICIALLCIIICGIVSLCFWFYISLLEKESDSISIHQGHYKDNKREGKWQIKSSYRSHHNAAVSKSESSGFYSKGLREGEWKIHTPNKQCIYVYDKGIVRESLCMYRDIALCIIYDENGKKITERESREKECQSLQHKSV